MPERWRGKRDREEKCKAVIFPTTVSALLLSALLGCEKPEERDPGVKKKTPRWMTEHARWGQRGNQRKDERLSTTLPRLYISFFQTFNLIIRYRGGGAGLATHREYTSGCLSCTPRCLSRVHASCHVSRGTRICQVKSFTCQCRRAARLCRAI